MNDHYFTREPQSASRPAVCTFTYRGISLAFQTSKSLWFVLLLAPIGAGEEVRTGALGEEAVFKLELILLVAFMFYHTLTPTILGPKANN